MARVSHPQWGLGSILRKKFFTGNGEFGIIFLLLLEFSDLSGQSPAGTQLPQIVCIIQYKSCRQIQDTVVMHNTCLLYYTNKSDHDTGTKENTKVPSLVISVQCLNISLLFSIIFTFTALTRLGIRMSIHPLP